MRDGTIDGGDGGVVAETDALPMTSDILIPDAARPAVEPLAFDAKDYLQYLDGCDLTLEEKIDTLHTLWTIMNSFVDRAWGIDSVQLLPAWREFTSAQAPDTLTIEAAPTDTFNNAAQGSEEGKAPHD